MDENVAKYYPNALCFEDLREIKLFNNWFDSKHSGLIISIDACKNTPEKPTKCAPIEETE